jgi:hypothetical protein
MLLHGSGDFKIEKEDTLRHPFFGESDQFYHKTKDILYVHDFWDTEASRTLWRALTLNAWLTLKDTAKKSREESRLPLKKSYA